MKNCICSFFGHREIEITSELKTKLKAYIKDLINNKTVNCFYFGGFGNFDELCWQIVTDLKQTYPYIKRIFCLSDPRHQRADKRPKWIKDEDYEEFIYLNLKFDYWYSRIYYRNCEMIDQSDYVIFYVTNTENSGAYKALRHAERMKKEFVNMGDSEIT